MLTRKFFSIIGILITSSGLALDCPNNDEKLIAIDNSQIGTSMYKTKQDIEPLEKCKQSFNCQLYTGGQWALNGNEPTSNISGISTCADETRTKYGSNCYCKAQIIDNFKVGADWILVKDFQIYTPNILSHTDPETARRQIEQQAQSDCEHECPKYCQTQLSQIIKGVHGFYTCANSLYKTQNVKCVLGDKIITASEIKVFDDSAEISEHLFLQRDTSNPNDFIYIGQYNDNTAYLRVTNTTEKPKFFVGEKLYMMTECL